MKYMIRWYSKILVLSMIINFVIECVSRASLVRAVQYMIGDPAAFILNGFLILIPFLLVFFVKRKIFLCGILTTMFLLAGCVNGFLLTCRTTPFTAADLRLAKYGLNMITTYMSWLHILLMAAAIAAIIVAAVVLYKKAPKDSAYVPMECLVVVAGASIALIMGAVQTGVEQGALAVQFGNIGQAYRDYGFTYCFSNSLFNVGISKPKEYGQTVLEQIEEEMIPENTFQIVNGQPPNIIMVQLESFFDPALWEGNPLEENPVPFFRYLKGNYPSGYLSVPSVGAGTANTEFECITGMNLDFFGPGEYPYKTILRKTVCESTAFNLKKLGYTAHAIHNNEGTFYDRNHVFSQLGFDLFTPIEYMYDIKRNPTGWCKDSLLTGEIQNALDATQGQDYIYSISVQGHGAYPDFAYYGEQIAEMDQFIRSLIKMLNTRNEPAVVVLYGDHLPGFEWEAQEMINGSLYQTEYVVWNNLELPAERKDLESYQLSAYVTDLLGIHEGTMLRYHQNFLQGDESKEGWENYLADMEVLEYDMLYGEQEIYQGEQPFEATQLQMGSKPITIKRISKKSQDLYLYGENFNEYSTVFLNEKPITTTYVMPDLIVAKQIRNSKLEMAEISVRQVGRDQVSLGDAVVYGGSIEADQKGVVAAGVTIGK